MLATRRVDGSAEQHILKVWADKLFTCLAGIASVFILTTGCIEEYNPEINEYDDVLVIDGSVVKGDSLQIVYVSRSSEVNSPSFNAVRGCLVIVTDSSGNEFHFGETKPGVYCCPIPEQFLVNDMAFQLSVTTPDNKVYISEYEKILASSPIDSVYYSVESYQSSSETYEEGLQFYTDLKAADDASRNYMWLLEETWESHTYYDIGGHWFRNGISVPRFDPVSDSVDMCWSTRQLTDFYISSTANLVVNEKKKVPLSYVPARSVKLDIKYSLLVKQYTLSNEAYQYHQLRHYSSGESGGLYQTQPAQSQSNIRNRDNPGEIVLGYFWASSYSSRRLFFTGPLTTLHANCDYFILCIPKIGQTLIGFFQSIGRDVWLVAVSFDPVVTDSVALWGYPYNQMCIDCTVEGGKTEKPEFWE